mmetsp:Transcript_6418/g.17905  ORF Transcript_6418/g.17905 Transcript_6418/m.17905 type:complete len:201 (+) Transcript_6418:252-854(+)
MVVYLLGVAGLLYGIMTVLLMAVRRRWGNKGMRWLLVVILLVVLRRKRNVGVRMVLVSSRRVVRHRHGVQLSLNLIQHRLLVLVLCQLVLVLLVIVLKGRRLCRLLLRGSLCAGAPARGTVARLMDLDWLGGGSLLLLLLLLLLQLLLVLLLSLLLPHGAELRGMVKGGRSELLPGGDGAERHSLKRPCWGARREKAAWG